MTTTTTPWGFYGRKQELAQLRGILLRQRWFFVQVAGRRRIGKTSLIQQAIKQTGRDLTLYIQIPDSDPIGVLAACNDYLQTFGLPQRVSSLGWPSSLGNWSRKVAKELAHFDPRAFLVTIRAICLPWSSAHGTGAVGGMPRPRLIISLAGAAAGQAKTRPAPRPSTPGCRVLAPMMLLCCRE